MKTKKPMTEPSNRQWEVFFRCQRNPIYRSQLLTSIMSGTVLDVERLPTAVLLDVVLLATAARETANAEIVTDYEGLLDRVRENWARPDWTCQVFSQQHARWADAVLRGAREFEAEERYIPELTSWYLTNDVPEYFV